jgi:hypothetical protein
MTPSRVATPNTTSLHARLPATLEPSNKRRRIVTHVTDKLGTLMAEDVKRLETVDIFSLFKSRQGRGDFMNLARIRHHPAHQYLKHISVHGAPVVLTTEPWTTAQNDAAMAQVSPRLPRLPTRRNGRLCQKGVLDGPP